MFSKGLLTASNNYLRLKVNVGERRPSIVGNSDERHASFTEHHGDRRPSFLAGPDGGHRPSITSQNGEIHHAMMELQENLGRAGTSTQEIEQLMGSPSKVLDQPDETLLYELKRNNDKYEYPHDARIWIYQWRANRDYVYFIISNDNKVIQSAWYYAFE